MKNSVTECNACGCISYEEGKGCSICDHDVENHSSENTAKLMSRMQLEPIPWYRASQDCICHLCGKRYGEHPMNKDELDWNGKPFMHRLCNGDKVKL